MRASFIWEKGHQKNKTREELFRLWKSSVSLTTKACLGFATRAAEKAASVDGFIVSPKSQQRVGPVSERGGLLLH